MRKMSACFLILTSLIAVTFLGKAGYRLSQYFSLDMTSKALSLDFQVSEKDPSSFALDVFYEFETSKKEKISGRIELAKPYFLNLPSANLAIETLKEKSWDVFYSQKNPLNNSLQKIFPFKDCIQALLTLGIFIYFLFFKKMMEKSIQEW